MEQDKALRERLEGYGRFNDWERQEMAQKLRALTVEESLRQYLELCDLARLLAPDAEVVFRAENKRRWVALRAVWERAAQRMGHAFPA